MQAAALTRYSPFDCQWRCRSFLSELRLEVDPPRLLVAAGASVSVECRLPAHQGALTRLSWSFRPAGGGECALTPCEEGEENKRPQCDGFGDAAQLYFVNQTVASSRLVNSLISKHAKFSIVDFVIVTVFRHHCC